MADVFRGKVPALSSGAISGYLIHGVTAVLAVFLLFNAMAA
jgi:hypothetical protein